MKAIKSNIRFGRFTVILLAVLFGAAAFGFLAQTEKSEARTAAASFTEDIAITTFTEAHLALFNEFEHLDAVSSNWLPANGSKEIVDGKLVLSTVSLKEGGGDSVKFGYTEFRLPYYDMENYEVKVNFNVYYDSMCFIGGRVVEDKSLLKQGLHYDFNGEGMGEKVHTSLYGRLNASPIPSVSEEDTNYYQLSKRDVSAGITVTGNTIRGQLGRQAYALTDDRQEGVKGGFSIVVRSTSDYPAKVTVSSLSITALDGKYNDMHIELDSRFNNATDFLIESFDKKDFNLTGGAPSALSGIRRNGSGHLEMTTGQKNQGAITEFRLPAAKSPAYTLSMDAELTDGRAYIGTMTADAKNLTEQGYFVQIARQPSGGIKIGVYKGGAMPELFAGQELTVPSTRFVIKVVLDGGRLSVYAGENKTAVTNLSDSGFTGGGALAVAVSNENTDDIGSMKIRKIRFEKTANQEWPQEYFEQPGGVRAEIKRVKEFSPAAGYNAGDTLTLDMAEYFELTAAEWSAVQFSSRGNRGSFTGTTWVYTVEADAEQSIMITASVGTSSDTLNFKLTLNAAAGGDGGGCGNVLLGTGMGTGAALLSAGMALAAVLLKKKRAKAG